MADAKALTPPPSLAEVRAKRKPLKPAVKVADQLSPLDKLAVFITDHVGTMGFFLMIFGWTVIWLSWNLLMPPSMKFDPPMGFVFYLFISNVIQILLMPLIMVGQNVQGRASDRRAENDLEINIKAEKEIEVILQHLEYQNKLLLDVVTKVDRTLAAAIEKREAEAAQTRTALQKLTQSAGAAAAKLRSRPKKK